MDQFDQICHDWNALSMALPSEHEKFKAGEQEGYLEALGALEPVSAALIEGLEEVEAQLLALDVLMVEAFHRRHELSFEAYPVLNSSISNLVSCLDIQPIVTYPLYIRINPQDLDGIRRFTALDSEYRFIRMHRYIEDIFDGVIKALEDLLDLDISEQGAALAQLMPDLREAMLKSNRMMAAFRDPNRMDNAEFIQGFRPYYASVFSDDGKTILRDGPSGLQSATFRILAMLIGYGDGMMGWLDSQAGAVSAAERPGSYALHLGGPRYWAELEEPGRALYWRSI